MIDQLLFIPAVLPFLILLYLLPGFFLSRAFTGHLRNQPLFWIFLSLLFNGTLYSFLAVLGMVFLPAWLLAEALLLLPFYFFIKRKCVFLSLRLSGERLNWKSPQVMVLLILLFIFFLLVSCTKFGVFVKRTPLVADDYSQIPKVVSIAATASVPKYFYYPLRNFSYYFYGQVSAGLLTRFTDNYVKVNRSFVINFVLQTAASLYLLWLASLYLFRNFSGRLFFLLPVTFFGGFEFPVAFLSGARDLFNTHLEYWPGFNLIRTMPQISSFATINIWAPQHLFSALLLIFIFLLIFKTEGNRCLKILFLSLALSAGLGFGFFSGLVLLASYIAFSLGGMIFNRRQSFFKELFPTLLLVLLLISPLLLIVGARRTELYFELSRMHLILGSGALSIAADFLISLPIYFFLELGLLFLGLIFALKAVLLGEWRRRETIFWLIPLTPLVPILFFKFPEINDFVIRSRSITPSLLALAVFTGWFGEGLKRRWAALLIFLFLATALSPFSEFVQNYKTTPRAYTFFSDLDSKLSLNSLVFTQERAAPYFWPVPIFIHRPTIKPNRFFDQVDLQYTGLSVPPDDGLLGDDYQGVRQFIDQHPVLAKYYHLYYLSLQELPLPVAYRDLDYRLYVL